MHKQGISHRDLKPENILLASANSASVNGKPSKEIDPLTQTVKICDLGAAKVLDTSNRKMNTPYVLILGLSVGRYYRAPELILGSNLYDCSIDIWAAGCIIFELVCRTPLFPGDTEGM